MACLFEKSVQFKHCWSDCALSVSESKETAVHVLCRSFFESLLPEESNVFWLIQVGV